MSKELQYFNWKWIEVVSGSCSGGEKCFGQRPEIYGIHVYLKLIQAIYPFYFLSHVPSKQSHAIYPFYFSFFCPTMLMIVFGVCINSGRVYDKLIRDRKSVV